MLLFDGDFVMEMPQKNSILNVIPLHFVKLACCEIKKNVSGGWYCKYKILYAVFPIVCKELDFSVKILKISKYGLRCIIDIIDNKIMYKK
jgi:hypothetical protein